MAVVCRHCVIGGRVQGVGFRAATKSRAISAGLSGWVRNLPDGTVECLLQGEAGRVDGMVDWLRRGPPGSRVAGVRCRDESPTDDYGFRIA